MLRSYFSVELTSGLWATELPSFELMSLLKSDAQQKARLKHASH